MGEFELVFDAEDIQLAYKGLKFKVRFAPQAGSMDVAHILKCVVLLKQITRKVGCVVDDD